jgi:hypothetical protein
MTCRPTTLATKYGDGLYNRDPKKFSDQIFEFADLINQEKNPADGYDRERLVAATNRFNTLSRRVDLADYPWSADRFNQVNNITYIEFADFVNQSGYDFDDMESILSSAYTSSGGLNYSGVNTTATAIKPWDQYPTTYRDMMDQFELYNVGNIANSISGGTCGGFGNPIGKLMKIIGSIAAGVALLKKLASFSLADLFDLALKAVLDTLKDKLAAIVDKLKSLFMQQLQNIINQVTKIANGSIAIFDEVSKRVNDAKDFFKDLTMEKVKNKIKEFVDKAIAQFEELTLEAILLLLFRFCQFAEMIQAFLKGPVDAVKSYFGDIARQTVAVQTLGLIQTQKAVEAGAMRFTKEARKDARKRMMDSLNKKTGGSSGGTGQSNGATGPRPNPEVYVNDPEITEAEARELGTMSDQGIPGKIKWAPSVLNMGKSVSDADDDAGWKMINMEVKVKLLRTATRMGRELTVNSGYRSPEYNRRIGGAKRSQHMSGYAIDVSMAGFSSDDIRNFIRIASQEGFMGMSYYPGSNFTHVDIGGRRTWGSNGVHSNWVASHVRDEFRKGASGMA